jgi:5'-methylthioadenosine phosphorylase
MTLGIIGGSGLVQSSLFQGWNKKGMLLEYPEGKFLFLQRHGEPLRPPHRIDHGENIGALKQAGATGIIAINSVGSLKEEWVPGTLVIPEDFFCPWTVPSTQWTGLRFPTPNISQPMREQLQTAVQKINQQAKMEGVYIQTNGPRFETKAEIKVMQQWGDVVGMTMASEATIANELKIPYASLCVVENWANGVCGKVISEQEIVTNQAKNKQVVEQVLKEIVDG